MAGLRSDAWYAGDDRNAYIHRAWMRRGAPDDAFQGRPQIAIADTASDLTPCNSHLNEVAKHVEQGVWEAGGVPLNLPVVSLGETLVRPTAMLWRNMAAMATEEMLRANPVDGVVLLGGCDKTIPSLLMAACSVGLPAVVVPGGPMLTGTFRGVPLGCGTDVWRLSEEVRAGTLSESAFLDSESSMIRSRGHCNTMGTASTMGLLAEALGMTLPGTAGRPAPDSRLLARPHETGRLAVEMVRAGRRPGQVLTAGSFHNAIVALAALGGSTNAVVHLLAIAGRLGVPLTLDDFDRVGAGVPLLVDLQPAGRCRPGRAAAVAGDDRGAGTSVEGLGEVVRGHRAGRRHRGRPRFPGRREWRPGGSRVALTVGPGLLWGGCLLAGRHPPHRQFSGPRPPIG
jgi:dihydroxyacid dehydratase/phosphogluconate dehydratase